MSRVELALRRSGSTRTDGDAGHPSEDAAAAVAYPVESDQPVAVRHRGALPPIDQPASVQPPAAHPRNHRITCALDPAWSSRLVVSGDASPAIVEQYGRLAATLYHARAEHGIKSIMISSALPREGKTLTAVNLALTLSESYRERVLLIDTDLRGAAIHSLFGLPASPGLGDFLDGDAVDVSVAVASDTLSVLAAGTCTGNPIAGLVSGRMKHLLERASARFDWVLLDTPPLCLLSDANLLARVTDGLVFVISAGVSPYPMVQRAIATVGAERILGIVLNRAPESVVPQSTYYQHYGVNASAAAGA
jgi:capsular exopolysaccharide synthesis family protein